MNLALFPPLGGSLTSLQQTGQLARVTSSYLPRYAQAFDALYYCSYALEQRDNFGAGGFPTHFHVLPNARAEQRHVYAWRMAGRHAGRLATCHVGRVFQATGIVPAWLAKRRWGLPLATTYGYHYAKLAQRERRHGTALYYEMLQRLALRVSDAIIVTTEGLARELGRAVDAARIHLIPNGVALDQFYPSATPARGQPRIVFIGRLSPEKNVASLLRAVQRLQPEIRPVVELAGDGPLRTALAHQADELQVQVNFLGVVGHERLPELLRQAHAFVLPSYSEGHPKALLEAMACGLPVVASDIPGNRSLVEDAQNGLLFAVDNDEQLAGALGRVLNDPSLAASLGLAARQTIVGRYDLAALIDREVDLLRALAEHYTPHAR
jgi:glycosyltransferase involved in cell wall biosynthesis